MQVALTNSALAELAERTLAATGLRAAISDDPELVIHDRHFVRQQRVESCSWIVPEKATAYTGPFIIDGSHPLAQGIALHGVVWAAAPH